MKIALKKHLMSNLVLKTTSCILGYSLWSILAAGHMATRMVEVPLAFYGNAALRVSQAPEKVTIALQSKRNILHALDTHSLAAHINADQFIAGPNKVTFDNKSLFLPDSIKLVHYSPINIVVHVQENQSCV